MRKLLLCLLFCSTFFLQDVKAQEFIITEAQLQTLETILQKYKTNNEKAQSQVKRLQEAQTKENQLMMNLRKSLTKYEREAQLNEAEKFRVLEALSEMKAKNAKLVTHIIVLYGVIVFFVLGAIGIVILKLKRIL